MATIHRVEGDNLNLTVPAALARLGKTSPARPWRPGCQAGIQSLTVLTRLRLARPQ